MRPTPLPQAPTFPPTFLGKLRGHGKLIFTLSRIKMKLQQYSAITLAPFARLHNLKLNGITIANLGPHLGMGIIFDPAKYDSADPALLTIDRDLILSAESVELAAKSDAWIRDLLKACCGIQDIPAKDDSAGHDDAFDLSSLQLDDDDEDEEELKNIKPWGRNPRLMIMLFLSVMMARGALVESGDDDDGKLNEKRKKALGAGTGGIWSEYIKFLPSVSIPTTWSPEECALLKGTSLDSAITAKISKLSHEFHTFQRLTAKIPWCKTYLWEPSSPDLRFTLQNWHEIDAWFRSRVLELPRIGVCLIPYLDMVNHSNEGMNAYYILNGTGNVDLLPLKGEEGEKNPLLDAEEKVEVRINYGAHKSSAELLFSYGFIDSTSTTSTQSCNWLSFPLPLPSSDPLTPAKEAILTSPPTIKLIDLDDQADEVAWISDAIWLAITNAEDGLKFHVLRRVDGGRELRLYWKEPEFGGEEGGEGSGEEKKGEGSGAAGIGGGGGNGNDDDDDDDDGILINDISALKPLLENSPLWEVFYLRAIVTLEGLVEEKLATLDDSESLVDTIENAARLASREGEKAGEVRHAEVGDGGVKVREEVVGLAKELRARERGLLGKAKRWFALERERVLQTQVVKGYLEKMVREQGKELEAGGWEAEGDEDGDGEEEDLS